MLHTDVILIVVKQFLVTAALLFAEYKLRLKQSGCF